MWIRWRWQHGFVFQPYTKYHAVRDRRRTVCGRDARHFAAPPWGDTTENPPEHQRCKQCAQTIEKETTDEQ